ncbi:hypothetical protein NicSoilC12_13780 [Arthrobacter sp. NicSoilC12]|nr:hypothetical protein NicSoilC12_13780 [Arthrobacter sp. NicSoilC12]
MSVASGYVHISVRNASKAGQASGIRQGFGGRSAFAPAGSTGSFPAPDMQRRATTLTPTASSVPSPPPPPRRPPR